jgi:hypothetical protein
MAERISPEELLKLVQEKQIEAIKGIEDEAVRKATSARFAALDEAVGKATLDWTTEFGSASSPGAGAALNEMIANALKSATGAMSGLEGAAFSALSDAVGGAVEAALEQGSAFVEGATGKSAAAKVPTPDLDLSDEKAALKAALADGEKGVKGLLKRNLVERLGLRGILAGLSQARQAVTRARATISTGVNKNVANAMRATATANKARQEVWIAERDACVRCTAYAGRVVDKGDDWPGGLSWDPNSKDPGAAGVRPPLHPNCRCRPVPWDESWKRPGEVSLPEAAKREAERSIARGFSLPGESNVSRIRALKELLSTNPALPKTVVAAARKAAAKGEFPKGRSVP